MNRPPVFIVGAPRSGTTLLRNALNRHPSLAICGETQFYRYVYSRRKAFGDLSDVRNRRRLITEYLATERILRLGFSGPTLRERLLQEATTYQRFFTCILDYYAQSEGKPRTGEKSPHHAVFAETLCQWYPGAAIIHLVRDPRDVVASLQRMPWASNSILTNARTWVSRNLAVLRCRHQPGYLRVHYEELVQKPEAELERICAHLGEPYSPRMLVPQEAHVTYSPRSELSRTPITKERLGHWRHQLASTDVALIEWIAGSHLTRFGYEPTSPPPPYPALARAFGFAFVDAVQSRMSHFPAVLYRAFRPTRLAKEEFWVFRRIRQQERESVGLTAVVNTGAGHKP